MSRKKHYCVSPLLQHWTLLWPEMWEVFPQQAILQLSRDNSWVSYKWFQFWYYLPGVRVRSHMIRVQSHKTATPANSDVNCKSRLSAVLLINQLWIRGSHEPLLDLINLLEQLTELRKKVLTRLSFYYRRIQPGPARWKSCTGQGLRDGAQSLHALSKLSILPAP